MSAQRRGHSDQSVQAGSAQASVLRLSDDLFGTAAERFRVASVRVLMSGKSEADMAVCTENLIRVDEVKESPKLTE